MQEKAGNNGFLNPQFFQRVYLAISTTTRMMFQEPLNPKKLFLALISPIWTTAGEDILVGGQAVFEGVMMRSPKSFSIAVRRPDRTIVTKTEALPQLSEQGTFWKWPVFRGMATLGQALVLGIRALKFSTDQALESLTTVAQVDSPEVPPQKPKELSSWVIGLNLLFALFFFVLLFKFVPLYLAILLKNHFSIFSNPLLFSLADGVVRMIIFIGYIVAIAQLKDIKRVFEYHGAEHKVVFTFEAGEALMVENARRYSTLHPRCGTSFLMVVMLISIVVYTFIPFDSFLWKLLSRILLIPIIAGLSYEIIRFSAKRKNWLLKWMTLPGLWLQKITTREPDDDQLEIAIRALNEALNMETNRGIRTVL